MLVLVFKKIEDEIWHVGCGKKYTIEDLDRFELQYVQADGHELNHIKSMWLMLNTDKAVVKFPQPWASLIAANWS